VPHDVHPDRPLTEEQRQLADSLPKDVVDAIDSKILAHAGRRPRKIAMLVALAMEERPEEAGGLPDVYYSERVKSLVARGLLAATGYLESMRYSEVMLPERDRDA
jgi:hypothetical protein